MGTHHRQDVRRIRDRAIDDIDDVRLLQDRDHFHGSFDMLHDPVQVRLKELLSKPWKDVRMGSGRPAAWASSLKWLKSPNLRTLPRGLWGRRFLFSFLHLNLIFTMDRWVLTTALRTIMFVCFFFSFNFMIYTFFWSFSPYSTYFLLICYLIYLKIFLFIFCYTLLYNKLHEGWNFIF